MKGGGRSKGEEEKAQKRDQKKGRKRKKSKLGIPKDTHKVFKYLNRHKLTDIDKYNYKILAEYYHILSFYGLIWFQDYGKTHWGEPSE